MYFFCKETLMPETLATNSVRNSFVGFQICAAVTKILWCAKHNIVKPHFKNCSLQNVLPSYCHIAFLFFQTCESSFATKDRLRAHMIRHEEKVPCHICGKLLSAAYITDHMRVHNQSQHHSCHLCNRSKYRCFVALHSI